MTDELAQRRALLKGLDALDALADQWADEIRLPAMIAQIMSQRGAADRVDTLVKLAWAEGAYAGRKSKEIQLSDLTRISFDAAILAMEEKASTLSSDDKFDVLEMAARIREFIGEVKK